MLKIRQMSHTLSDKSDGVIPWTALASSQSKIVSIIKVFKKEKKKMKKCAPRLFFFIEKKPSE